MRLDPATCRGQLDALALPSAVLKIFDGKPPHPLLADCCAAPYYVFAADLPRLRAAVVPLWENGIVVTAYAPAGSGGHFVTFSLEAPDALHMIGSHFGAVVADLLLKLWEDEVTDDGLADVASVFAFDRTAELLHLLATRSVADGLAGYAVWRREFLRYFDVAD